MKITVAFVLLCCMSVLYEAAPNTNGISMRGPQLSWPAIDKEAPVDMVIKKMGIVEMNNNASLSKQTGLDHQEPRKEKQPVGMDIQKLGIAGMNNNASLSKQTDLDHQKPRKEKPPVGMDIEKLGIAGMNNNASLSKRFVLDDQESDESVAVTT